MDFLERYKQDEKKIVAAIAVETARLKGEHQRLTGLQKNEEIPPRPPAPVPGYTKRPENPVRRQEDLEERTAAIKRRRAQEADEMQTEQNRILDHRVIPGVRHAKEIEAALHPERDHRPLCNSDMENGMVVPGRVSFRTGQTRQA